MMTVKTQITFRDFLVFNLKNSLIRIVTFSLIALFFFAANFYNAEGDGHEIDRLILICWPIFFTFIIIRSYFSVKKNFFSNKNIQETITYTFTDQKIRTEGETFDADFTWDTVHKVKENKDWFLIYQSAQVMNMVSKKNFTQDQAVELRNIIKSNNVKAKLRND
jgi:hypothetical protein